MNPQARTTGQDLTPYPKALALIKKSIRPLGGESVAVGKSLGCYLAQPVKARHHSPRFAQSSMDGFAVKTEDLKRASGLSPVVLDLVGEIPAGSQPQVPLRSGQTVKVFTGGQLPAGADAVVMLEVVTVDGEHAVFREATKPGTFVRPVGAEYRRGEVILAAGMRITPPVVGVLASLGQTEVAVGRRPRVTVITMGDELVAPGESLGPGKIRDANGPALVAALQALGCKKVFLRRVGDRKFALKRSLSAALGRSDMVITVGGASVGDHDHAGEVRGELGIKELYTRVAIKPGKPNMFGLAPDGTPVFSLPGNPVSALVSFHQLVKPGLKIALGSQDFAPQFLPAALGKTANRLPPRLEWLRCNLANQGDQIIAQPGSRQESHMLSGLAAADLLGEIPPGYGQVVAGETIKAYLLEWDR